MITKCQKLSGIFDDMSAEQSIGNTWFSVASTFFTFYESGALGFRFKWNVAVKQEILGGWNLPFAKIYSQEMMFYVLTTQDKKYFPLTISLLIIYRIQNLNKYFLITLFMFLYIARSGIMSAYNWWDFVGYRGWMHPSIFTFWTS